MKNKSIETIKTLFVALVWAMCLAAAAFAQKPERIETNRDLPKAIGQTIRQNIPNKENMPPQSISALTVKNVNVSSPNQTNFNIGSEFVKATVMALLMDGSEDGKKNITAELNTLIGYLEAEPEAAALRKTLRSVGQGTADADQVYREIDAAADSYLDRLNGEQGWYFNSGYAVMYLMVSTYLKNDELIKKSFTQLQKLIKTAPVGTSAQILTPMKNLLNYAVKTSYSQNDYNAIIEGAGSVANSVNA